LLKGFQDFVTINLRMKDEVLNCWNETRFGKRLKQLMEEYPNEMVKCYSFNCNELARMLKDIGLLTEMSYMFVNDQDDGKK
jgi:hypothetical protein